MRKNSYIFTAILAIMVSTGAWAYAPGSEPEGVVADQITGAHDVYSTEDLADSGIAGVTYVNRVANRAGAAAQAAEDHAAHASKSAYAAQTSADDADTKAAAAAAAAAAAQSSADAAATAANSITNGNGIIIDTSEAGKKKITVNEGVGLKFEDNVLVPNLAAGDSVTITPGTGDDKDKLVISVQASDTILDAATNQVLGNVYAGTAITVTPTLSGGEVTDIEISANAPTANTPGVVQMPTYTELQVMMGQEPELPAYGSESEAGRQIGLSVETYMNAEIQRQIDMTKQIDAGSLSGSYQTYADATSDGNKTDATSQLRWKTKPLSAAASYELALLYKDETVSLMKDNNGNPIDDVGTNARPVYVNNGTAAAVQSVAIPVGGENFEETITSANVAKIWIQ